MNEPIARARAARAAVAYARPLTDKEFWAPISARNDFWERLGVLPWANALVKAVGEVVDEWYAVTAPSRCTFCMIGKQRWWNRFTGKAWCNRLVFTVHKHLLASRDVVLIDDNTSNCRQFAAAGGAAILFPAHHNALHTYKNNPLTYVNEILEQLTCT